jgi:hypothetical protein
MDASWLDWVAVAALGGLVGTSELVSRYKDAPGAAIKTLPAIFYVVLNCAGSLAALELIHQLKWSESSHWAQILMAGVSAMAFFRTSLFVVRAGDRDVGVGPSGFLQIFLTAADRAVDRKRAAARAGSAASVMKDVDYQKAKVALPALCLALMQNVSDEDQKELGRALQDVDDGKAEAGVKAFLLGIELINVVGVDVLTTAVGSLGAHIRSLPKT